MTLISLLLCSTAFAQAVTGGAAPDINSQIFRPSIDGARTFSVDDSRVATSGTLTARFLLQWANRPLVYVPAGETEELVLVDDVFQLDAMAGYAVGPVRLGIDVPVYLYSSGASTNGETGLGDIALAGKLSLLDEANNPIGLALGTRLALPTATVSNGLGSPGLVWDVGLIADKQVGNTLLAANLGTHIGPEVAMENAIVNDQLTYGVGVGHKLGEGGGLSGELVGVGSFGEFGNGSANPLEAILGTWIRPTKSDLVLRLGYGLPLSRGIGAPQNRVLLALAFEPPLTRDSDGDGYVDDVDACPEAPEDFDQYKDDDGCPEPTEVRLSFVDGDGVAIDAAVSKVEDQGGTGPVTVALEAGDHALAAEAPGFVPIEATLQVPPGPPIERQYVLEPMQGTLIVRVVGPDGEPVEATVGIDDASKRIDRELSLGRKPGQVRIAVDAPGYLSRRLLAEVRAGEETVVELVLEKELAQVTAERIDIKDSVYFETAKAVIKSESFPLLDQVATIMKDHDEIELLRIEGHTDVRGGAKYNLDLSRQRVASVRQYLVEHGVAAERLESEGYGESRPIDPANNAAAWEKNRRVDFFIAKRADAPQAPAE